MAVVLLPALACTATRGATSVAPRYVEDFDRLLWLIDHEYPYRDRSGCDTTMLRQQLRSRAAAADSAEELLPVMEEAVECLLVRGLA